MAGVAAGGLAIDGGRLADVTIFHGGPIRTMEDARPAAEAVAARGGVINPRGGSAAPIRA